MGGTASCPVYACSLARPVRPVTPENWSQGREHRNLHSRSGRLRLAEAAARAAPAREIYFSQLFKKASATPN
jgi:hypothetical protein